ncbi:MAG: response regulator transcription factor [Gammaproteobacteria bacterium]
MHILIIEDDALIGAGIRDALLFQGDVVDWVNTAAAGFNALRHAAFDLAIIDLGLPDEDGLTVIQRARQLHIDIPILILTARHILEDRVRGLDAGADDYLIKPFDIQELNARLRALVRRHNRTVTPLLIYGEVCIDPANRHVTRAGEPVSLSRREYLLLSEMMAHPNRVFTREHLTEKIYEMGEYVESNALEVHIHHLRKKFGRQFIKTERGIGYRLTPCK